MTQEEISPENLKKGDLWNKPKTPLMIQFEKETGNNAIYRGYITGQFDYWLNWTNIKYKSLKCDDPNCPKFGQEFPSKRSLANHINWHNPKFRDKQFTEEHRRKHK